MFKPNEELRKTLVTEYNEGSNCAQIGRRLQLGRGTLSRWMKSQPDAIWRSKKTHDINSHFFSRMDTGEKAYILGFICADGHVSHTKSDHSLAIELAKQDREVIEYIRFALGYTGKIKITTKKKTPGKQYVRLRMHDIQVVKDLLRMGLHCRKTYGFDFVQLFSDQYIPDFIRGFLDGDGCVSVGYHHGHLRAIVTFVVGARFDLCLSSMLTKIGVKHSLRDDEKCPTIKKITVEDRTHIIKLCRILYNGGFCLKRKYEKYKEFLRLLETKPHLVPLKTTASHFYGVTYDRTNKKWKGQIKHQGKSFSTKRFDYEIEAARAVNELIPRFFDEEWDIESRLNIV